MRTIFDQPHHQSLELLAARGLANNDLASAFRLADRRCRILPLPEAHSYVLRAAARHRRGDTAGAIADLGKALEIAPDDLAANRRMLTWADGLPQSDAARSVIEHDSHPAMLQQAVRVLHRHGQRTFARLDVSEDGIDGWAIWPGDALLDISIRDGVEIVI